MNMVKIVPLQSCPGSSSFWGKLMEVKLYNLIVYGSSAYTSSRAIKMQLLFPPHGGSTADLVSPHSSSSSRPIKAQFKKKATDLK